MGTQVLRSPEDTEALAFALALGATEGECFALVGDLGAGKTLFVKGLARGLGFEGEVTSPTFSLVHEYRGGRLDLFHFDFYRIDSSAELLAIGWDDYLETGGVVAAEWADRFPELMPAETRWLRFTAEADGSRVVAFT